MVVGVSDAATPTDIGVVPKKLIVVDKLTTAPYGSRLARCGGRRV
jgi:hypothetical protein